MKPKFGNAVKTEDIENILDIYKYQTQRYKRMERVKNIQLIMFEISEKNFLSKEGNKQHLELYEKLSFIVEDLKGAIEITDKYIISKYIKKYGV